MAVAKVKIKMLDELLKGENLHMSLETLISVASLAASGLTWFIRLENRTKNNTEKIEDFIDSTDNRFVDAARITIEKVADVSVASSQRYVENQRAIEKNETRIDRVEARHEATSAEVRSMLMAIQASLSNLEGRLALSNRVRDDR